MLPTANQLPTFGYLHKVVCDCLGLWNSESQDVTFHVSATEKDRRIALRQAFEEIKNDDGAYGSLDDLVAAAAQFAPKDAQKVKKSRTIHAYVNHLSKNDFESFDEYLELSQYIKTLISERYVQWGVSELAVGFYVSALAHYREFVREHACSAQSQVYSFQFFLSQNLRLLAAALADSLSPGNAWPDTERNEQWPLRGFADDACRITGISLHKLHQYHAFQQEKPLKEQAWNRDFTSQLVNTQSKQVIDRLRKHSRMKWETFYPTLQPLTYHLPEAIGEKAFAINAFAALIAHNLNVHVADCGPFAPPVKGGLPPGLVEHSHSIPSSDLLDLLFNDYPIGHEAFAQQAPSRFQTLLDQIRALPSSLNRVSDIPDSLELAYKGQHRRFIEGNWHAALMHGPNWLNEWGQAREAMFAGDSLLALTHFKTALEQSKYVAGPLFIPFYIQACAFCKSQYRRLSEINEEELFERFYEQLGSDAAQYAGLMGYTPHFVRDPGTLIPSTVLPLRFKLMMSEIDALARTLA
ncbi:hypothetical protein PMI29_05763 [Pseudomonas sp. GM49]|uniref:hypothetical protein n=1 Tax=Pseudomonas sp. GM49 TaxID=1144331 RepID=UPI00027027EF|nr:hypothetical protein [Pseudomonas sp. GM49]EJM53575.1 hypothetical protein PMI29_05763 [Pseudomonas sp. GM49]